MGTDQRYAPVAQCKSSSALINIRYCKAVFFNLFAAAEPFANICVAHGILCNSGTVVLVQPHRTAVANFFPGNFGLFRPGVTNLFTIAGHFVSYRWVSEPHNFLVILWNLLKTKKMFINRNKQAFKSRLNASRAARNSFAGRMFVTYSQIFCTIEAVH